MGKQPSKANKYKYQENSSDNITIYVKKMNGENIKVNLGFNETIRSIKLRIKEMLNIKQKKIKLNYQNCLLNSSKTAKEVGLTDKATVYLIL